MTQLLVSAATTSPPPISARTTARRARPSNGKGGDIATNRRDEQELSVLCLRVLQAAVVYVNTLMVQDVLAEGLVELGAADRRGLTPLFWTNISPYGEVRLNMANRLALRATTTPDPAGGDDDPGTPSTESSEGQPR